MKLKDIINSVSKATIAAALSLMTLACNKSSDNQLKSPDNENNAVAKNRKALMIVIDGGFGAEIEKIAPPVMLGLTDNAIFSWDALTSTENTSVVTNQQGWATLLTGVQPSKHQVQNSLASNNFTSYPTLFTRLKQLKPQARSVAFTANADISGTIAADATSKQSFTTDAQVKDATVNELKTGNPDFLLVQFSSVDIAGAANGYLATAAGYRSAVLTIDNYIGELVKAINERSTAADEDWMVMITSGKGNNTVYAPTVKPWAAYDDPRHNNFFISFNPRFAYSVKEKPLIFPYYGSTYSYRIGAVTGTNRRTTAVKDATALNLGATGSYTIQCKIKTPVVSANYPSFLGKRATFNPGVGNEGWLFFIEGSTWRFNAWQGSTLQVIGANVTDNKWHTLTVVINQVDAATRNVTTYTDGVKNNTGNLGTRNMNSTVPFTVGWRDGSNGGDIQMSVTDIRIQSKALTDAEVSNNYCRTDADLADPSLLAFWPSTELFTDNATGLQYLKDMTANGRHLYANVNSAASFNDVTTAVCPLIDAEAYKLVPNAVDVAAQLYQWLGFTVSPSWNLDGQSWIPKYIDVTQ